MSWHTVNRIANLIGDIFPHCDALTLAELCVDYALGNEQNEPRIWGMLPGNVREFIEQETKK